MPQEVTMTVSAVFNLNRVRIFSDRQGFQDNISATVLAAPTTIMRQQATQSKPTQTCGHRN